MRLTPGRPSKHDFLVLENSSKIPIFLTLCPRCNLDFGMSASPTRINQIKSNTFCFYVGLHISVVRLSQDNMIASCRHKPKLLFLLFFTIAVPRTANRDFIRWISCAGKVATCSFMSRRECAWHSEAGHSE